MVLIMQPVSCATGAVTLRPGVAPFFEVPVEALQRIHASKAQAEGTKSAQLEALKGVLLSLKDKIPTGVLRVSCSLYTAVSAFYSASVDWC